MITFKRSNVETDARRRTANRFRRPIRVPRPARSFRGKTVRDRRRLLVGPVAPEPLRRWSPRVSPYSFGPQSDRAVSRENVENRTIPDGRETASPGTCRLRDFCYLTCVCVYVPLIFFFFFLQTPRLQLHHACFYFNNNNIVTSLITTRLGVPKYYLLFQHTTYVAHTSSDDIKPSTAQRPITATAINW